MEPAPAARRARGGGKRLFVIVDMKWFVPRKCAVAPTQIAAVRVDGAWKAVGRFATLIRPDSGGGIPWKSAAFSGSRMRDFLSAPAVRKALSRFSRWLKPDDVLLWWAGYSQTAFQVVARRHPDIALPQADTGKCLGAVREALFDAKSDASKLARARGIAIPDPPHASNNDVSAIRALLEGVALDPDWIDAPPKDARGTGKALPPDTGESMPDWEEEQTPYLYDPEGKLLHLADCARLTAGVQARVYTTAKSCIREGLKPCPACCRARFRREAVAATMDAVHRSEYNYVYSKESKVFHTPECAHVRQILHVSVQGAARYETCVQGGRRPCRHCKPVEGMWFYRKPGGAAAKGGHPTQLPTEKEGPGVLRALCEERDFAYKHACGVHYIVTPVGKWRIEEYVGQMRLWHVNKLTTRGGPDSYHLQPVHPSTLRSAFRYIRKHDDWLLQYGSRKAGRNPKESKGQTPKAAGEPG